MISKKHCKVFCKTTEIFSGKILKTFWKHVERVPAKVLRHFLLKYWKWFCNNIDIWSAKIPRSVQKQPPEVFYEKSCSYKFRHIHRKTPCWNLFLITLQARPTTYKRLQHRCFSVNSAKFLRTPFLKSICEQLLFSFLQKYWERYFPKN